MTVEFIHEWATRTPAKVAVRYNKQDLTYPALAERIVRAQAGCADDGMSGPGVVMLAMHDLLDVWILGLALRDMGLTTIVIPSVKAAAEVRLPGLRYVLADRSSIWPGLRELCQSRGWSLFPVTPGAMTCGPATRSAAIRGGVILRTSGTTGIYKMVLIDPSFEAGFLAKRRIVLGIDADTVLGAFDFPGWTGAGYKMPVCVWEAGGTVVIRQGGAVYETLCEPDLTHAALVPHMLAAVLAAPEGAYPRSERLRLSFVGGPVTQAQIDAARRRITPLLYNRLGATETSIFGFTPLEEEGDHRWHRPVPGAAVEIVDEAERPVPVGTVGRLRVATAGGPTAYLHDAAASAAMFRDGFFYPGDLAVGRADGRFALQGRTTDVINIGGHKISPAPAEEKMREELGLSGLCILAMPNARGDEELHVVIEAGQAIDPERLRRGLENAIGDFGTAHVHVAGKLPRNDLGKVIRREVRAILANRTGADGA